MIVSDVSSAITLSQKRVQAAEQDSDRVEESERARYRAYWIRRLSNSMELGFSSSERSHAENQWGGIRSCFC